MLESVAILLVRGGSEYVLQHRDNKPTIADPDTYSTWGGRVEAQDKSMYAAAIRELKEETGTACAEADLQYLGDEQMQSRSPDIKSQDLTVHYFALEIDSGTAVESFEGQGVIVLPKPYQPTPKVNPITKEAIKRYETAA